MDIIKKIFKSRLGLAIVMFAVGGMAATFLLPEKIVVKKEKEIVEVEKIVEKEVEVEKIVYRDRVREVKEKVRVVKRKETFPDGHVIEEEIYESESEQVDRIRLEEKNRYMELLAKKESEFNQRLLSFKEHVNPKRFTIFAGYGVKLTDFKNTHAVGGFNYTLWGPFTIGGQATTNTDVALTIGLRF